MVTIGAAYTDSDISTSGYSESMARVDDSHVAVLVQPGSLTERLVVFQVASDGKSLTRTGSLDLLSFADGSHLNANVSEQVVSVADGRVLVLVQDIDTLTTPNTYYSALYLVDVSSGVPSLTASAVLVNATGTSPSSYYGLSAISASRALLLDWPNGGTLNFRSVEIGASSLSISAPFLAASYIGTGPSAWAFHPTNGAGVVVTVQNASSAEVYYLVTDTGTGLTSTTLTAPAGGASLNEYGARGTPGRTPGEGLTFGSDGVVAFHVGSGQVMIDASWALPVNYSSDSSLPSSITARGAEVEVAGVNDANTDAELAVGVLGSPVRLALGVTGPGAPGQATAVTLLGGQAVVVATGQGWPIVPVSFVASASTSGAAVAMPWFSQRFGPDTPLNPSITPAFGLRHGA